MARRARAETGADKPNNMISSFHPYADIFPLMEGSAFDDLVADIKKHGLREPVVEMGNAILDGRNRFRACAIAGVPAQFTRYDGSDPLGFVLSRNLHRRHLNESARAMVAASLETLRPGRQPAKRTSGAKDASLPAVAVAPSVSREDAARLLNISPRSVADAKTVKERGTPTLIARVARGELAVSLAAKIARLPAEAQQDLAGSDEAVMRGAAKSHRRAAREVELADATRAASERLGREVYSVIMADPPWRFEVRSRDTGMDRSADNHYPTMTTDDIRTTRPPAGDDCVLFLWTTPPMLPQALDVMAAWGFVYKSHCVWSKDRIGTGYWFRFCHELLLVGTKGDVPAPPMGEKYVSVVEGAVGAHSEKPDVFYEIIEDLYPSARPLEMFARQAREGWDAWGNEAPAGGSGQIGQAPLAAAGAE